MAQITGGRVVYGRTVQPAQYESKKAEVEFTFAVAEGEDHNELLERASAQAIAKAHEMVGIALKSAAAATSAKPAQVAKPAEQGSGKEAAAAAMNAKEAKPAEPAKRGPGRPPRPPAVPAVKDPADLEDDAGHAAAMEAANKASEAKPAISTGEERVDPTEELWADEPAIEITDKDLTDLATKHNARLKKTHEGAAPGLIKKLIASYFPEGAVAQLAKLPKDKRADFKTKLEALA